jgi:hypothetical protein
MVPALATAGANTDMAAADRNALRDDSAFNATVVFCTCAEGAKAEVTARVLRIATIESFMLKYFSVER